MMWDFEDYGDRTAIIDEFGAKVLYSDLASDVWCFACARILSVLLQDMQHVSIIR